MVRRIAFTQVLVVLVVLIPVSPFGPALGFAPLPLAFWLLLVVLVAAYPALVELVKRRFEPRAQSDRRS